MSVLGASLPARHTQHSWRDEELPRSLGRTCGMLRGEGEISKQEEVAPRFFKEVKSTWSAEEGSQCLEEDGKRSGLPKSEL